MKYSYRVLTRENSLPNHLESYTRTGSRIVYAGPHIGFEGIIVMETVTNEKPIRKPDPHEVLRIPIDATPLLVEHRFDEWGAKGFRFFGIMPAGPNMAFAIFVPG